MELLIFMGFSTASLANNTTNIHREINMTMMTNIRHFLDENDEAPNLSQDAKELLNFLSGIIESASTAYDTPVTLANVKCLKTVNEKSCSGEIEVWVFPEDNRIGWECLECGDEGIISNWEGTQWDKRNYIRH